MLSRAADLGIAFQLTNIARDVLDDARNGRVYLPDSWLAERRCSGRRSSLSRASRMRSRMSLLVCCRCRRSLLRVSQRGGAGAGLSRRLGRQHREWRLSGHRVAGAGAGRAGLGSARRGADAIANCSGDCGVPSRARLRLASIGGATRRRERRICGSSLTCVEFEPGAAVPRPAQPPDAYRESRRIRRLPWWCVAWCT